MNEGQHLHYQLKNSEATSVYKDLYILLTGVYNPIHPTMLETATYLINALLLEDELNDSERFARICYEWLTRLVDNESMDIALSAMMDMTWWRPRYWSGSRYASSTEFMAPIVPILPGLCWPYRTYCCSKGTTTRRDETRPAREDASCGCRELRHQQRHGCSRELQILQLLFQCGQ